MMIYFFRTVSVCIVALAVSVVDFGRASAQTAVAGTSPASQAADFPAWAYPWAPDFVVPPPDDNPQRLPGSSATFSWKQARDLFFAADWHPEEHGPLPDVVKSGRKPDVRACASCHRAEGTGGPENASLAGLDVGYFKQQMADFKSGARKFSGPPRAAITIMTAAAKAITDAEVATAAEYFAALKHKRVIKVAESDMVPRTYIARLFFAKQPGGATEPLGRRIIEVPDDLVAFELRDGRAQFTAYVPVGSVAKGEALAKAGGADTTAPCTTCHGPDMKGIGPIPRLAGRSPTYIFRQLYDFQQGMRTGTASALMQPMVAKLSIDDMISLAAYAASLEP